MTSGPRPGGPVSGSGDPVPRPPRRAPRSWSGRAARLFRALYGESPLHLLVLLASFVVCGYAAARLLEGDWLGIVEWFVGAAVIHDLVFVPLYGSTDWVLHRGLRTGRGRDLSVGQARERRAGQEPPDAASAREPSAQPPAAPPSGRPPSSETPPAQPSAEPPSNQPPPAQPPSAKPPPAQAPSAPRIALLNHIRVPAFLSFLLLLVYWPLIRERSGPVYAVTTRLSPGVFLGRWLLVTAVLFAVSALLFAVRWWRGRDARPRRARRRTAPAPRTQE